METRIETGGAHPVWFAAANAEHGFENRFPALFGMSAGVEQLYIVKGGPGTGKSGLLRRVARAAERSGWRTESFLCSSDPASLDGLWLTAPNGHTVGMLDGTAPHAWEPSLPGARENLLDLGGFWDTGKLAAQRDTIARLNIRKSAAYERAYRCLRAAGEADRVRESLIAPYLRETKLDALAERLLRLAGRGARTTRPDVYPYPQEVFRRGYSMSGYVRLDTPDRLASRILCVGDHTGTGYLLLHRLRHRAAERGIPVTVFCDPLRPERADGILFRENGLCVLCDTETVCSQSGCTCRTVSLRTCMDADGVRRIRPMLRESAGLRQSALTAALHHLATAAESHFALESLYGTAMDFSAVSAFGDRVCERILGTT